MIFLLANLTFRRWSNGPPFSGKELKQFKSGQRGEALAEDFKQMGLYVNEEKLPRAIDVSYELASRFPTHFYSGEGEYTKAPHSKENFKLKIPTPNDRKVRDFLEGLKVDNWDALLGEV